MTSEKSSRPVRHSTGADTGQLAAALSARYHIEREIGHGGMAVVYLARDIANDRDVALKVLRKELGVAFAIERFQREISVTARLEHPNLLPMLDSGEAIGRLYYVTRYIAGESLRDRLDRERQLSVNDAVSIAGQVADALDHAHRQGFIHRDLKPENILLQDGKAFVADFGIALAITNAAGDRITQTGFTVGTPSYMSPEQASADREVDRRSDVFSLGVLLYEMLAGKAPHEGPTAQVTLARVLAEVPKPLRTTRPTVPPHVDAAISKALEKAPNDRYSSARAFANALRGLDPRDGGIVAKLKAQVERFTKGP